MFIIYEYIIYRFGWYIYIYYYFLFICLNRYTAYASQFLHWGVYRSNQFFDTRGAAVGPPKGEKIRRKRLTFCVEWIWLVIFGRRCMLCYAMLCNKLCIVWYGMLCYVLLCLNCVEWCYVPAWNGMYVCRHVGMERERVSIRDISSC